MLKRVDPSLYVCALTSWTIRQSGDRFYICPTGTGKYGRKYKTLRHACMGIARKLEAEYARRKARSASYYGGE